MAETIRDQLVAYLKDAHALEQMSLQMTDSAAKAADDSELRGLFEHHHEETEGHERMIRERLEALGEGTSTIKDLAARVAAITKGMESALPSDAPGRLVRDGYTQEHMEVASYELLMRVAERAGDGETANVARTICANERETADKLAGTWDRAVELSLHEAGVA
jgi:ferritin-like metal-binding protein YciE